MSPIEIATRRYLTGLYRPGPSVEVGTVENLGAILDFARSKGWLKEEPGGPHGLSDTGIAELSV